jgi:hypothetical protein
MVEIQPNSTQIQTKVEQLAKPLADATNQTDAVRAGDALRDYIYGLIGPNQGQALADLQNLPKLKGRAGLPGMEYDATGKYFVINKAQQENTNPQTGVTGATAANETIVGLDEPGSYAGNKGYFQQDVHPGALGQDADFIKMASGMPEATVLLQYKGQENIVSTDPATDFSANSPARAAATPEVVEAALPANAPVGASAVIPGFYATSDQRLQAIGGTANPEILSELRKQLTDANTTQLKGGLLAGSTAKLVNGTDLETAITASAKNQNNTVLVVKMGDSLYAVVESPPGPGDVQLPSKFLT